MKIIRSSAVIVVFEGSEKRNTQTTSWSLSAKPISMRAMEWPDGPDGGVTFDTYEAVADPVKFTSN